MNAADQPPPTRKTDDLQSGKPIVALIELLGRRWMLRVIWELRDGALNFRDLQEQCGGVSSSVLNQRLWDLREAGIAELTPDGYRLTTDGSRLLDLYPPVKSWAEGWARREARKPRQAGPEAR